MRTPQYTGQQEPLNLPSGSEDFQSISPLLTSSICIYYASVTYSLGTRLVHEGDEISYSLPFRKEKFDC